MILKSNQVIHRSQNEILFSGTVFCPKTNCVDIFGIIIERHEDPELKSDVPPENIISEIMVSLGLAASTEIECMNEEGDDFHLYQMAEAIDAELPLDWSIGYISPQMTIWKADTFLCDNCFFETVNTFYVTACLNELQSRCSPEPNNRYLMHCSN